MASEVLDAWWMRLEQAAEDGRNTIRLRPREGLNLGAKLEARTRQSAFRCWDGWTLDETRLDLPICGCLTRASQYAQWHSHANFQVEART
jgi:hypothetical protein